MEIIIEQVICPSCNNNNIYGHLGNIDKDDTLKCNSCNEEINVIKNIRKGGI